ncbi:MAG: hypothetical protein CMI01_00595 [Oceanospirillaceae bacterium]|nr:hypothetical protein [Oceanospirillaceae bacterium]
MRQPLETRHFYRNGPDYAGAEVVDFAAIRRRFDFRTIRIGRWVKPAEQQRAARHFHDALCDLMQILQVPEEVISLRGTLGLHYGAGGRPGVAAHYDAGARVFALAKNAGPGSIAHEWFHAFDHYIASNAFQNVGAGLFGSRAWLHDATAVEHPLNVRLYACYHAIMLSPEGDAPSELVNRSMVVDRNRGDLYYSLPEEVCARAFEAWVQDAPLKNHFLVKGTRQTREAQLGLYPEKAQKERVARAFTAYFSCLGQLMVAQKRR